MVDIRMQRALVAIRDIIGTPDADLRDIESALETVIEETSVYLASIQYDIARLNERQERAFEDGQVL